MSLDERGVAPGDDGTNEVENSRHLLFQLGGEIYGTPLIGVREVIKIGDIKPLPYMLPHFKGMINLRGQVIGIIDLRIRFQVPLPQDGGGLILVIENEMGVIGAIIDDVLAVTSFQANDIMQNDRIHTRIPLTFFKGVAKHGDRLVSVIDLAACMSAEDYSTIPSERKSA